MRINAVTALFDNCRVAAAVFDCIGAIYCQCHVQLPASTLRVRVSAGGRRRRLHWRALMPAACANAIFGISDALQRWCVKSSTSSCILSCRLRCRGWTLTPAVDDFDFIGMLSWQWSV